MTSPQKGKSMFGPLFRACRAYWRATHRRQPVYGLKNITDQPAVFISRHQNLYGPVEIMAWVPLQFRVWTLYKFMSVKECYRHYSGYTYSVRKKLGGVLSKLVAAAMAPFATALMRSMGGIPVYRGQRNIIDTFRLSVKALTAGENILIMPERDYLDNGSDAGELYTGFVNLAQMYHRATGRALSFYPVYACRENGSIYVERPIVFDPAKPFRAERDRIVEALKKELNHQVIEQDFHAEISSGEL